MIADARIQPIEHRPTLRFRALGPFEVHWNGRLLNLGGAKQQMVLALLVLEANQVVSVDRLLAWVWDDGGEPRNAATLQVYVSNWRRELTEPAEHLGRQLIFTRRPGYELQVATDESDLLQFEALRRRGEAERQRQPAAAAATFRAALAMWRGEPFDGLPVDPNATTSLRLARTNVIEQLAEAELEVGHHRDVIGELQSWVSENPLNESLRGHLMLALYRSGRQADALATFRDGRVLLAEELGIDPSRELRDLENMILRQDPSLDAPGRLDPRDQEPSTQVRSSVLAPIAILEHAGGTVRIDQSILTIGRLSDRDLVLDDTGVSRVHAEVRRVGNTFVITDLGSANGTVVNGRRDVQHVLQDGDVIRLGAVELRFWYAPFDGNA